MLATSLFSQNSVRIMFLRQPIRIIGLSFLLKRSCAVECKMQEILLKIIHLLLFSNINAFEKLKKILKQGFGRKNQFLLAFPLVEPNPGKGQPKSHS